MTTAKVIMQYVVMQRGTIPEGWRVLADGQVQQVAKSSAIPAPTQRLDTDIAVEWETTQQVTADQVEILQQAIQQADYAALPSQLLISYCKEDPGTAIWVCDVAGQPKRVVVWDPKPQRHPAIDQLQATFQHLIDQF